jgi:hypothetical protein
MNFCSLYFAGVGPSGPPARRIIRFGAASKESDVAGPLGRKSHGENGAERMSGAPGNLAVRGLSDEEARSEALINAWSI